MPQSSGSVHFESLVVDVLQFPKAFHFFSLITPRHSACRPIGTFLQMLALVQLLCVGFLPSYFESKRTGEWGVISKLFLIAVMGSTDPDVAHNELRILLIASVWLVLTIGCIGFSFWWFCRRYEVSGFVQHTHALTHFLVPAVLAVPLVFLLGTKLSTDGNISFCVVRVPHYLVLLILLLFCLVFYAQPLVMATPITGESDFLARLVPDNMRHLSLMVHLVIILTTLMISGDTAKYFFAYCCLIHSLIQGVRVWKYPLMSDDGTAIVIVYFVLTAIVPVLSIFKAHYRGSSDSSFLLVIITIGFLVYNLVMRSLTHRRKRIANWLTNDLPLVVESKEELMDVCQIAVSEGKITPKLQNFVDTAYEEFSDPDVLMVKVFLHMNERKEPSRDFVRSLTALMHYNSMKWGWWYATYCLFRSFTRCNDILNVVSLTDDFDERIRNYRAKRDMFWASLIQGKIDLAQKWNAELRDDFLELRFDYHVIASFYDMHPRVHELNRTFFYEEFSLLEEDPMVAITSKIKNSLSLSLDGTMRVWNYIVGLMFLAMTVMIAWPFAHLNHRVDVLDSSCTILLESIKVSRYWAETAGHVMDMIRDNETIWANSTLLDRLRTRVVRADRQMTDSLNRLTLIYANSPHYRHSVGRPWFMSKMVHHTYRMNNTLLGTVESFLRSFSGRICGVALSPLSFVKTINICVTRTFRQINSIIYAILENCERRAIATRILFENEVFYGKQYLAIGLGYSLVVSVITYTVSQTLSTGYLSKAPTAHPNPEYGLCTGATRTAEPGRGGLFFKSMVYQTMLVLFMVGQAWYVYNRMLEGYSSATNEKYLVMNRMGQYFARVALYWLADAELEVCPEMSKYVNMDELSASVVQTDLAILDLIISNREDGLKFMPFSEYMYNVSSTPTERGVHDNWPVGNLLRLATYHINWDKNRTARQQYRSESPIRKRLDKAVIRAEIELEREGKSAMSGIIFYFAAEIFLLGLCHAIHYMICQVLILTFPEREETLFHHIMSLPPQFIASQKGLMEMIVPKMEKERPEKSVSTFLSLFEASYLQLLVVNSNLVIIGFTRPVQTLFGYKYDQLIGQNLEVLIPKSSRESVDNVALLYERLAEKDNFSVPLIVGRSSDNGSIPVSAKVTHIIKSYILLEFKSVAEFINFRDVLAKHRELIQDFEKSALPIKAVPNMMTSKKPLIASFKRGTVVLVATCHDEIKMNITKEALLATQSDLIYGIRHYSGEGGIFVLAVDCCHIIALVVCDNEGERTDIRRALDFMTRFSRQSSLPSFGVALTVDNPQVLIFPLPQMKSRRNLLEQNFPVESDSAVVPSMTVDMLTPGVWEAIAISQYVSLRTYLLDGTVMATIPSVSGAEIHQGRRPFYKVEIEQIPPQLPSD